MSRLGGLPSPPHGDYPPSPPPPPSSSSRAPPRPPPLRVNTHSSTHHAQSSNSSVRSAGHSPIKPGFSYNLPTSLESPNQLHNQNQIQSRARPGGWAAIAATSGSTNSNNDVPRRVRSPPITPGSRAHSRPSQGAWSTRRGSNESSVLPPSITRQGSAEQRPIVPRSRKNSSGVTSPPPLGSIYSGREGVGGYSRVEGVSSPNPSDLQLFAHHCRLFYFSPSPPAESADYISSTLAALPPSHRAAYTRLQSSLRSLAHLHHLRLRISSFHALISSTVASASLTPLARQQLLGPGAKGERYERTKRFISTWCTSDTGGVEPFFRGLWGALRLQSRGGPERGGGGSNRVVWEVDDAVFLESGGTEFMHEAVTLLKGVLGFDDQPLTSPPKLRRIRTLPRSYLESRSRRSTHHQLPQFTNANANANSDATEELLNTNSSPPPSKNDNRSRASSDPFIDRPRPTASSSGRRGPAPPPPPSRRQAPTIPNPLQMSRSSSDGQQEAGVLSGGGNSPESPLLPHSGDSIVEILEQAVSNASAQRPPVPPLPPHHRLSEDRVHLLSQRMSNDGLVLVPNAIADDNEDEDDEDDEPTEDDIAAEEANLNQPRFRLWIFPAHITDEEAERLMSLFPRFINKKADIRFPFVRPGRGIKAMEEARWDAIALGTGGEGDSEPKVIRVPKVEIESEEGVSRCGTGRVWVGTDARTTGWQSGGWFRFKRWWRRLFGLA
ncbi:hypothetical protein IAT40_003589 [Kwoniella sp. CBS 6097]